VSEAKELPPSPGAIYESFLRNGEFRLQCCTVCGRQIFFPRTICPHCGSNALEWRKPSGRGTVYSTTTIRQRPDRGGDYNLVLVDLAEGARMMSRVEGMPPAAVQIGMAVQAFIAGGNGGPLVVFRAAES